MSQSPGSIHPGNTNVASQHWDPHLQTGLGLQERAGRKRCLRLTENQKEDSHGRVEERWDSLSVGVLLPGPNFFS